MMLPFFGVNIAPVRDRLGIGLRPNREDDREHLYSLNKRNRARTKYGLPFTSQWKLEIHNVAREVSWQDLKDFCFQKSNVRPSHANVHTRRAGVGTISLASSDDMKKVAQRLSGVNLNGKPLRIIDALSGRFRQDSRRVDRHRDEGKTERTGHHGSSHHTSNHHSHHEPYSTSGRSSRRPRSEHHKENRHDGSSHGRSNHRSHVSQSKNKEDAKVIIHQPTGDKVITEKIDNIDAYHPQEVDNHSDNEQSYFKRHRRSSHSSRRDDRGRGRDVRFAKKTRAIYKYGMPYQTKWKIRVENLSPDVSWQDLKDLIRPYADVRYADAHKPIQGEGNICVNRREGLNNVISNLHESEIKGMIAKFIDVSAEEEEASASASPKVRSRSPHKSNGKSGKEEEEGSNKPTTEEQ